jgi:putative two-component system response regulator
LLDAFDALTSERPYKRAFTVDESCDILGKEAETGKWDPRLLKEFLLHHQASGENYPMENQGRKADQDE